MMHITNWKLLAALLLLATTTACSAGFDLEQYLPGYNEDRAALDDARVAVEALPENSAVKPVIQAGILAGQRVVLECETACKKYGESVLREFKAEHAGALAIGRFIIRGAYIILGTLIFGLLAYFLWRPVTQAVARALG